MTLPDSCQERETIRSSVKYFADEMGGYFADPEGFHDPEKAARHAVMI